MYVTTDYAFLRRFVSLLVLNMYNSRKGSPTKNMSMHKQYVMTYPVLTHAKNNDFIVSNPFTLSFYSTVYRVLPEGVTYVEHNSSY